MKKILGFILIIGLLSGCSNQQEKVEAKSDVKEYNIINFSIDDYSTYAIVNIDGKIETVNIDRANTERNHTTDVPLIYLQKIGTYTDGSGKYKVIKVLY